MSMKHTPGPWSAHARTVTAPETEDRLELSVQINGGNRNDNKANARLIAAAPDLLDAMGEMLSIMTHAAPDELQLSLGEHYKKCVAVHKRATGAA